MSRYVVKNEVENSNHHHQPRSNKQQATSRDGSLAYRTHTDRPPAEALTLPQNDHRSVAVNNLRGPGGIWLLTSTAVIESISIIRLYNWPTGPLDHAKPERSKTGKAGKIYIAGKPQETATSQTTAIKAVSPNETATEDCYYFSDKDEKEDCSGEATRPNETNAKTSETLQEDDTTQTMRATYDFSCSFGDYFVGTLFWYSIQPGSREGCVLRANGD